MAVLIAVLAFGHSWWTARAADQSEEAAVASAVDVRWVFPYSPEGAALEKQIEIGREDEMAGALVVENYSDRPIHEIVVTVPGEDGVGEIDNLPACSRRYQPYLWLPGDDGAAMGQTLGVPHVGLAFADLNGRRWLRRDNAPVQKVSDRKSSHSHIAEVRTDREFTWEKQPFHSHWEVPAAERIPAGCQ